MTSAIKPYLFQARAVRAARRGLNDGRKMLIVSPPASGKTVMVADLTRRELKEQRRVLIIAQRREILNQTFRHLLALGVHSDSIGCLYPSPPGASDPARPVQLASVALLLQRSIYPRAHTVILDEAHHAAADGHLGILNSYVAERVVGLTATPIRMDGRGLGDIFDELYTAAMPSELIKQGLLACPRCFSTPDDFLPNLKGLRRALGDFVLSALNERVNLQGLVGNIIDHYRARADGHTALVFATTLEHSRHIVARFNDVGIPAEHLDSSANLLERDRIVQNLQVGKTRVVSNMGILHEGFDLPRTYAVILARPTLSLGLYLQQTGLALRKYGSRRPLILDHACNVLRFGLPEADREYNLQGTVSQDRGHTPVRLCPMCLSYIPSGCHYCPECGAEVREVPTVPVEDTRTLEEVTGTKRDELALRIERFMQRRKINEPEFKRRCIEAFTARNSGVP